MPMILMVRKKFFNQLLNNKINQYIQIKLIKYYINN